LDGPAARAPSVETDPRRRRPRLSPITRRILAINIFALAILVVGLLYVGRYRQELVESEFVALANQAEMFAAAIGESAVGLDAEGAQILIPDVASQILMRLARTTHTQAQLITAAGVDVTDSRHPENGGDAVDVEDLPPPVERSGLARLVGSVYESAAHLLPGSGEEGEPLEGVPPFERRETHQALDGETGRALRSGPFHRDYLSVAVPVQRYKQVLGAVVLTRDARTINAAVFQIRLDILKVFGIALLITIGLSVYLAGTIARPLRRLALAADRVKRGLSRQYAIPLVGRHDEIRELSGALHDMTEALWKRMDAIEGFAADVAHEIKNPLTSLRSAIETASRITDPAQQQRLMSIVIDDIQRLDRLISDISNASRLDAELSRAEMVPIDIAELLDTMIVLHEAAEDTHGVKLERASTDGRRLRVVGDQDGIVQVFRNLIDNAVSFSPVGTVIRMLTRVERGMARIDVEDQGPGIPPGLEEAIFQRFYRERPVGEKFGTHSGLGLSISRQIVEAHNGSIRAENRLGPDGTVIGARFIVQLPMAE
jgi:two-component system sensor histidine kinase ChvG